MTKYSFSWNSNAQIIYAYRLRSILTNDITLITFGGTYYLIIILPQLIVLHHTCFQSEGFIYAGKHSMKNQIYVSVMTA